jgi:hypothetical protein
MTGAAACVALGFGVADFVFEGFGVGVLVPAEELPVEAEVLAVAACEELPTVLELPLGFVADEDGFFVAAVGWPGNGRDTAAAPTADAVGCGLDEAVAAAPEA